MRLATLPLGLLAASFLAFSAACSSPDPEPADPLAGLTVVGDDPTDVPLRGASNELVDRFLVGDALFDAVFREPDGLGPLYIRAACSSCHDGATRGPGAVQKVVLVEEDGVTPAADQSSLAYGHTVRPYTAGGATTPITAPEGMGIKISQRLGPAVFGRGYMEAVDDAEIERVEAEQALRTDGIHGRINRVTYASKANPGQPYHAYQEGQGDLIGRFGMKGRIATLDEFTADAAQGDMGITSPMRPDELINPDGLDDDAKAGVDIDIDAVNAMADYMRLLEIPDRKEPDARAAGLFEEMKCAVCHVPSLKTRADYPIQGLAGVEAPVYTDFLLHEMGDLLADGLTDGEASPGAWKTPPLIGLRHFTAFMHDGRAKSIEQAVLAHEGPGSEANEAVGLFKELPPEDRAALLEFVAGL
ncbi:MAG: hypothetical protein HUU21_10895 [Polyangiaceae bacterium]|nr:hypothetical protein [Polyangiaceae bacterium]